MNVRYCPDDDHESLRTELFWNEIQPYIALSKDSESAFKTMRKDKKSTNADEGLKKLLLTAAEQTQETIEDCQGMGGAAGYIQIDRQDVGHSVAGFRMVDVRSAGDGAGTDNDDNFG